MEMINFSPRECNAICDILVNHVTKEWIVGRGRKYSLKGKDEFFMLLTILKHGETWEFLGQMFKVKAPNFEKPITNFLNIISPHLYDRLVVYAAKRWTISRMMKDGSVLSNFKFARYTTDVTFQQSNRPSGNMEEGKLYFGGKLKLYGFKTEVSVLPKGIAIGCKAHYPGPVSDIDIFIKNITFHEDSCEKRPEELQETDVGIMSNIFKEKWAIFVD